MLPEGRRVSMLDLDRHLSQVLEQARDAPVCVQRYGQPWVWLLSSDAWFQAARWAALETRQHPLMRLREALDPLLGGWPSAALPAHDGALRQWQRTAVLVHLRALDNLQRLHDGLRFNVLYRDFVGIDESSAWSLPECRALLDALQHPALQRCVDAALGTVPPVLVNAARSARGAARHALDPDTRCLSN